MLKRGQHLNQIKVKLMLKFKNKKLLISECASLLVERKLFEETKESDQKNKFRIVISW